MRVNPVRGRRSRIDRPGPIGWFARLVRAVAEGDDALEGRALSELQDLGFNVGVHRSLRVARPDVGLSSFPDPASDGPEDAVIAVAWRESVGYNDDARKGVGSSNAGIVKKLGPGEVGTDPDALAGPYAGGTVRGEV